MRLAAATISADGHPPARRRRILLLTHGLPVGGTEMLLCSMARHLPRARHLDVEVGCLDEIGILGEDLRREGVPIVCYERRPGVDLRVPARIAAHVRRRSIDLIHAHQLTSYVNGVMAKVLCRVPLVFTEHGRFYPDVSTFRRRLFNKVFARLVDQATAVSGSVRASLASVEGFAEERVDVIPNGIDVDRFASSPERRQATRRALGIPDPTFVVGTVSRLDPIKNQALLLEAFASVARRRPETLLLIVGDGSERGRLEARASGLALDGRVRFLGSRSDVPNLLSACDLFALSSFSEGIPVCLLEAMAASVPIVSTAVGGIPEILVHGEEAWLVPAPATDGDGPGGTDVLASALERMLVDPGLRAGLARRALERVRRDFSLEALTSRYGALYDRILSRRS